MIELTQEELKQHFSEPIFGQIAETADALGLECYVVGGYVRDIFLQLPSKDIDVVVMGTLCVGLYGIMKGLSSTGTSSEEEVLEKE